MPKSTNREQTTDKIVNIHYNKKQYMKSKLSHIDQKGEVHMVDVGMKESTQRSATACSTIYLPEAVVNEFKDNDIHTKKGSVFQTAKLAGIMGAKQTSNLIPLCHPLPISKCDIQIEKRDNNHLDIICTVNVTGKTGVEMEALTGASIAALTFYDMCKALSHDIKIINTRLIKKTGGKSDFERDRNQ